MKTRTSFVGNSSSSSFIVVFPRKPLDASDLRDFLFPRNITRITPYAPDDEEGVSVDEIINKLWTDMSTRSSATKKEIKEALQGYEDRWCQGDISRYYDEINRIYADKTLSESQQKDAVAQIDKLIDKMRTQGEKHAYEEIKRVMALHDDSFIFIDEYEDHNGLLETTLEQGDIFQALYHIEISHH